MQTTNEKVELFWSRVNRTDPLSCWPWLAATSKSGYGVMQWNGKIQFAHRIAYDLTHGESLGKHQIRHTCENALCCNPSHLYLDTPEVRFWRKVRRASERECWQWVAGKFQKGYGVIGWNGRNQPAHRVAWQLTFGPIPEGLCVCHHCDDPSCCNPSHLFLGTNQDNVDDRERKGRNKPPASGERHWNCRLSDEQVAEIRQRHDGGQTNLSALGREFGVSGTQVSRIVHRKIRC